MFENGTSPNETAVILIFLHLDLLENGVFSYIKGVGALKSKKKGRQSMTKDNQKSIKKQTQTEESVEALQAELERLRMENAYLKVECLSSKQGKITKQDKAQVIYELRKAFPVKAL